MRIQQRCKPGAQQGTKQTHTQTVYYTKAVTERARNQTMGHLEPLINRNLEPRAESFTGRRVMMLSAHGGPNSNLLGRHPCLREAFSSTGTGNFIGWSSRNLWLLNGTSMYQQALKASFIFSYMRPKNSQKWRRECAYRSLLVIKYGPAAALSFLEFPSSVKIF